MTEDQASLNQFGVDVPEADEVDETPGGSADEDGVRRMVLALDMAPDNAEPYADDSCPWCLAPASDFDESGKTSCGNCDAVIPTHMNWYQRGEKVCF